MPAFRVRIFLLGPLRLEMDGLPYPLPQRETLLRLFVRLTLESGKALSRKTLAFSFWSDESETNALANLRRHLYLLRNALPEKLQEGLEISTQTVSFRLPPETWLDVFVFEKETHSRAELEAAANLYTGDLAQGVEADDFLFPRREELRTRYLNLLKSLTQRCIEEESFEAAIRWAHKLTAQDPWDEEAARLCMTAEYMGGNRTAALAQYKTLEENLQREIGVQPMPETMELYRDILHHHLPRQTPQRKPIESTPFISRETELNTLENAFRDIQNGQGGFVFINGPAGVGKTTLTREALRRSFDANKAKVFFGNCQSSDLERPYSLWKQIFNVAAPLLARRADVSQEWLNHLLPLVPDLSLLRPGLIQPTRPDSAELRAALRQGLYALAEAQPLLLVIEDAHWMDADSLNFLTALAEASSNLPILFLVTQRIEESPLALLEIKRALRRKRHAIDLSLQTFTDSETRQFLETTLGVAAFSPEAMQDIAQYAQGLPLLLREAIQILQQQSKTDKLPSLRESFRMRLEHLTPTTREMLEVAAILGFSFSDNELRAALEWTPASYAAGLDSLQSERFVLETLSSAQDEYTFPHHLIHEIILDEIPDERNSALQVRVAHALEHIHTDEVGFAAEIAIHYQQADMPLPAARFWLKHAQESVDLAAFDSALEATAHAESLLGDSNLDMQEVLAQAALQRGVIALYQGQGEAALPLLDQAVLKARPFPSLFANALSMQAYALYTQDNSEAAYRSAAQAYDLSTMLKDIPNAVRAINIQAVSALMLGRTKEAVSDLQQALSLLEQHNITTTAQTVQSLNHLGTALVFAQEYTQAQETLERTVKLASQGGLRRLEAAALTMLGQIALNCGRYEQSIRIYDRAIQVAGESYLPGMWGKFAGRGWTYARIGNLTAAKEDFERGSNIARRVESQYGQLLMRVYLAYTALANGIPADSLQALEVDAAALNLHPVVLLTSNIQGQLWRLLGNLEQANAAHARALTAARSSNVPQFIQMIELQELLNQLSMKSSLDDAEAKQEKIQSLYQSAIHSGEVPLQSLAQLTEAFRLFRAECFAESMSTAQQALTLARSCPDQPLIGECLSLLLQLYGKLGKQTEAKACQEEIRALADSSFAPLWITLKEDPAEAVTKHILNSLK
ncbi:MAG: AAA family ATPase [Anaerolineales bacterium]|nr:AAA family ATPase [Anaerolineales bacterium]